MTVALGFALAILAVGLWLAANASRAPLSLRTLATRHGLLARLAGFACSALAATAFAAVYGSTPGALLAIGALLAAASLAIVALPLAPRAVWGAVAAAAVAAPVLGAAHAW